MGEQLEDDDNITVIETIVEYGDWVIHQWRTTDGTLIEEYRGAKRIFILKDFEDRIYG